MLYENQTALIGLKVHTCSVIHACAWIMLNEQWQDCEKLIGISNSHTTKSAGVGFFSWHP